MHPLWNRGRNDILHVRCGDVGYLLFVNGVCWPTLNNLAVVNPALNLEGSPAVTLVVGVAIAFFSPLRRGIYIRWSFHQGRSSRCF